QVEFNYGPEERAIKLAGLADIRFGKNPRVDGILSAREVDLDRALDLPEPAQRLPLAALRALAETVRALRPAMPMRLGISVDSMTLAGGALQGVRGDLRTDVEGLDIETFELRAPGATQVRISGRLPFGAADAAFRGPVQIEANDPRALMAWLEGRSDPPRGEIGSMGGSGGVGIGASWVAIERLKAEEDRMRVEWECLCSGSAC